MRIGVRIGALAAVVAVLTGCGGASSATDSRPDPAPLRVTTSSDIGEMVDLLEEDKELVGRYRRESKRCAAEGARSGSREACFRPLKEKLSQRFAADEARMAKLIPQVGPGCRKALREESIFQLPDDNSLEACERTEGT